MRTTSKLWRFNFADILNGIVVSVLSSVNVTIYELIASGVANVNWTVIGLSAVGGFLGYILKKIMTPKQEIRTLTSSIGLPKQPK